MRKKILAIFGIFLFAILFANFISADLVTTNPQLFPPSSILSPTTFTNSMCVSNQDFIVQVSPSGCQPAVVRSDLLAQQDVQVYCPLAATQLNPLINVKAISGISFSNGNYPKYVNSVGFYPAQAALSLGLFGSSSTTQTNYPVLSNIGYAVIDLKQIQNESAMPDFVTGNLTANLQFNAQNIFGVGNTNFYLPQMSDADWQNQYLQYGFWNGKGFLRATNIQGNSATVQIYDGNLNPVSSLSLQPGQTSAALPISGFDLCTATMQVTLNGLKNADTMANLNINGNGISVVQGQPFLNNQCQVNNIVMQGLTQDVQITCNTDSGSQTFDLKNSPRVALSVTSPSTGQTTAQDYSLGSFLYNTQDGKSVFLAYIGGKNGKTDLNDLYVVLVALPQNAAQGNSLTNSQLSSITSWIQHNTLSWQAGIGSVLNLLSKSVGIIGITESTLRAVISGQNYAVICYSANCGGTSNTIPSSFLFQNSAMQNVAITSYSQSQDQSISPAASSQYYQNAASDYQTIVNSYTSEIYPPSSQTSLGEEALYQQMYIANALQQKNTLSTLCSSFKQKYPSYKEDIYFCSDLSSLSSQSDASNYVSISGQTYLINLKSIYQPTYEDFGADVVVKYPNGDSVDYQLTKNQPAYLDDSGKNPNTNDFIELTDVNNGGGIGGNGVATIVTHSNTITLKQQIAASLPVTSSQTSPTQGNNQNNNGGTVVVGGACNPADSPSDCATGSQCTSVGNNAYTCQTTQTHTQTAINTQQTLNNYILILNSVNLKQFASVSVTPTISNAGASAPFSFNIGIEKRAIQLTPDQIQSRVASLNSTISQWQGISNAIGSLSQSLSTACTYTGIGLWLKNFVADLGGQGLSRQAVMNGAGGWYSKCSAMVSQGQYSSQDQCLIQNSAQIDSDVNQWNQCMNNQNTQIQQSQQQYTTSGSLLGQDVVDTNKFMQNTYISQVDSALSAVSSTQCDSVSVSGAATSLITNPGYQSNFFSVTDARNIELYSNILSSSCGASGSASSDELKNIAKQQLCSTLTTINTSSQNQQKLAAVANQYNAPKDNVFGGSLQERSIPISITTPQPVSSNTAFANQVNPSDAKNYYFIYQDQSSSIVYFVTYNLNGLVQNTYVVNGNNLQPYTPKINSNPSPNNQNPSVQNANSINPFNFAVKIYSSSTYNNKYIENQGATVPEVQYFETGSMAGTPAIVPFDLQHGWYVAIQQNAPSLLNAGSTATQSVTAAGQVQSLWLCNVGPNGIEEFQSVQSQGAADDQCEQINSFASQVSVPFAGLDSSQTSTLVNEATSAEQQAARARANNPGLTSVTITINGQNLYLKVGTPATNSPALQCTDFMSPSDCNILFNVCDPVVCPPSRCNFGGAYNVQDVVQTGIIGSIFLCLPNSIALGGSDVIPVCLPGIGAGIDNYVSILKSERDCLQNNLATGKMTGICDELTSIYKCQFFWNQLQPLANVALPAILSSIGGQNTRGGGEYLYVQNALQAAQQSKDYITNYYAANSQKAYQLQSTQNVGSTFCQAYTSLTVPGASDIANSLSTVDSPPQYTGYFQEIPFTTATVPPTSQYQVYYHIDAGKNSGIYYSVYLQRTSTSSYYQSTPSIYSIDSGYIPVGGTQDQTKNPLTTSGYNQLCINVNGQANCGFQEVSTSLATNIIKNQYLSSEASNTQIATQSDCVSGTANVLGLATNPNIQNGVTNTISPQLQNSGITRICATSNPGQGTDPSAGTQNSRWIQVGTCGSQNIGCWLDTQSVKSVINSPDIATFLANGQTQNLGSTTLQGLETSYDTILQNSGYLSNDQYANNVSNIEALTSPTDKITAINAIINKVFYNNQKAYLFLLRGEAYSSLAINTKTPYKSITDCENAGVPDAACMQMFSSTGTSGSSGGTTTGSSGTSNNAASTLSASSVTPNVLGAAMALQSNCKCGANCQSYAQSIINAASTYNEDPARVAAIMIQESNCDATAQSPAVNGYSSVGLMQIYTNPTNLQQCGAVGVNTANDVTGSSSTSISNNIQCGALILNNKYKQFSGGVTWTCTEQDMSQTYSIPYTGWDAAIRGYIGTGCTGQSTIDVPSYVTSVKNIYSALVNSINSQTGNSQTSVTTPSTGSPLPQSSSPLTSDAISQYQTYKSSFDKYALINAPTSMSQSDFEALLVAIAQQNNWGNNLAGTAGVSPGDWLMGYHVGTSTYQGADKQVNAISKLLGPYLSGNLPTPSSGSIYSSCSSVASSDLLTCLLTVLNTQQPFNNGFVIPGLFASNTDYAKSVLTLWGYWKSYLSSVSGSAH